MGMDAIKQGGVVVLVALVAGCHSPGAPSTTSLTLYGKVLSPASPANGISGATVTIADGPDAGKSVTTSGSGTYTLTGLQQASFTITVSAAGFVTESMKVTAGPNQFVAIVLAFTALNVELYDALIYEDVYRQVPGATVQLMDGPQAGASAMTDANGVVHFEGAFGAPLTLSIRKDGYYPIQTTAQIYSSGPPGTARIDFELKAPDLVQLGSGKYSITIATDGSCLNIPADLQTRTYSASAVPFTGARAGDGYTLTLDSPPGQAFELDVSGRDVSINIGDDFGPFGDPSSGLSINATGIGTVATSPASVVSIPLSFYQFRYQRAACSGSNGLFTLTSQ
jgi:hypothetical protein